VHDIVFGLRRHGVDGLLPPLRRRQVGWVSAANLLNSVPASQRSVSALLPFLLGKKKNPPLVDHGSTVDYYRVLGVTGSRVVLISSPRAQAALPSRPHVPFLFGLRQEEELITVRSTVQSQNLGYR
jgi:hypothetical protein